MKTLSKNGRYLFGILVLFSLLITMVGSQDTPPVVKNYFGEEVSALEPYVYNILPGKVVYRNPDGTYSQTIGQNFNYVDDKTKKYPNYVEWNENFSKIINSTGWGTYENDKTYISDFNTSFRENPNGQAVRFEKDGVEMTFQPHALKFIDKFGGTSQISMPQANGIDIQANEFIYVNAYGNGLNLTYSNEQYGLKENLVIESLDSLGLPPAYMITQGNITLGLDFIFSTNAGKIKINGVDWDKKNDASSSGRIGITDSLGNEIYHLPAPIITDSAGNSTVGEYKLKGGNGQNPTLYISLKVPYEWLQNAVYPVFVDPTVTLDVNTDTIKDAFVYSGNPDTNYGTDNYELGVAQDDGGNYGRSYVMYNTSSISPLFIYSIDSAIVSLQAGKIDPAVNVSIFHLNNSEWVSSADGSMLNETQITWNNQPCGTSFTNSTNCNLTEEDRNFVSELGGYEFNITNMLIQDYPKGNISFVVYSVEGGLGSGTFFSGATYFKDKAQASDTYAYLTYNYTPYIDIITPTPSQIFTEDAPTANLNISTAVAMDVCYYNNGTSNYTMSSVNSTFFSEDAGSTLLDGSHTLTFLCNESSDGTWHQSDSVSFDVDSVNVTTGRDLTVNNREYLIQNNISSGILNIDASSIILNGLNNYLLQNSLAVDFTGLNSNISIKNINFAVNNSYSLNLGDFDNSDITIESCNFYNTNGGLFHIYSGAGKITNLSILNTFINGSAPLNLFEVYNLNMTNVTIQDYTANNDGVVYLENVTGIINNSNIFSNNLANYGIVTGSESSLNFYSTKINTSGYPIFFFNDGLDSSVFLINATYANNNTERMETGSNLTRQWYTSIQVNDTSGNPINGATVNIYDKDNTLVASELTGADGKIARQEITEYVNNGGTKTYSTPHTINVTATGYVLNSTTYNLTTTQNLDEVILMAISDQSPSVTVYEPVANANSSIRTINFTALVSDAENLSNVSLYINSTGSWALNQTNSSGLNNTNYTFTLTLPDGNYLWAIEAVDNLSQATSTNYTLLIDGENPLINLISPSNGNVSTFATLNLTANLTDNLGLRNATLFIYWNNGTLFNQTEISNLVVGTLQQTIGVVIQFVEGTFKWFYQAFDLAGNKYQTANYTQYVDLTIPHIDYVLPADGSLLTSKQQTFTAAITATNGDLKNATLTIYQGSSQIYTVTKSISGSAQNISEEYTFADYNNYKFNVQACDLLGFCNQTSNNSISIYAGDFIISNPSFSNTKLGESSTVDLFIGTKPNNEMTTCNLSLTHPNGAVIFANQSATYYSATQTYKSSSFLINTTQTYNLSASCIDKYNTTYSKSSQISPTYTITYIPTNYSFAAINEKNETNYVNISSFDDSNGTIIYNVVASIENSGNFTLALTSSTLNLNTTDSQSNPIRLDLKLNASNDISNGTYAGNITFTNSTYNVSHVVYFQYGINPPAGQITTLLSTGIEECSSVSTSACSYVNDAVSSGQQINLTYLLNNTGAFAISNCSGSISISDGWYSFSDSEFSLAIGETKLINITMNPTTSNPGYGTSQGYLSFECQDGDLLGNPISTPTLNRPFIRVGLPQPQTPGGGSSGGVIVPGEQGWSMEVSKGQEKYEIAMAKGTDRVLTIDFENLGDSERLITLSCVDIEGDVCKYVSFIENPIILPLQKDTITKTTFLIELPEDIESGDYVFNIRGTDDLQQVGDITVFLGVGTSGLIVEAVSRLSPLSKNRFGIPYLLIFLPVLILSLILFGKIIPKKFPLKALWVIIISLGLSIGTLFI